MKSFFEQTEKYPKKNLFFRLKEEAVGWSVGVKGINLDAELGQVKTYWVHEHPNDWEMITPYGFVVDAYDKSIEWAKSFNSFDSKPLRVWYKEIACLGERVVFWAMGQSSEKPKITRELFEVMVYNKWKAEQKSVSQTEIDITKDYYVVDCSEDKAKVHEVKRFFVNNWYSNRSTKFSYAIYGSEGVDCMLYNSMPEYADKYPVLTFKQWEQLKNKHESSQKQKGEQKVNQEEFTVSVEDMMKIMRIACASWKKKIKEYISKMDGFGNVTLSKAQVSEMYSAASESQKSVLDEVFPDYEKEVMISRDDMEVGMIVSHRDCPNEIRHVIMVGNYWIHSIEGLKKDSKRNVTLLNTLDGKISSYDPSNEKAYKLLGVIDQ